MEQQRAALKIREVAGMPALLAAVACAFGAWSMLLPVIPLAVLDAGGSTTLAGATTGVFMFATVVTQMFTPWALRRAGYRAVMIVAALLLGLPALGYLVAASPSWVLVISAIRGIGFGALTVAEAALIALLAPPRLLGKASGALGIMVGVAQLGGLPLGLAVAEKFGAGLVYVLGALIGVAAVRFCVAIPHPRTELATPAAQAHSRETPGTTAPTGRPAAAIWKLASIPALSMCTIAMGFGALSSFIADSARQLDPARGALVGGAALALAALTQMVGPYLDGVASDRSGVPGRYLAPALLAGAVGMAGIAAVIAAGLAVWWLLPASALFGLGFGAVQNEALLLMFYRLPAARVSLASALWNMAFDSGTGIGSVLLGLVAGWYAYQGAFLGAALILLGGLLAVLLDWAVGRKRLAPQGYTQALFRQLLGQ